MIDWTVIIFVSIGIVISLVFAFTKRGKESVFSAVLTVGTLLTWIATRRQKPEPSTEVVDTPTPKYTELPQTGTADITTEVEHEVLEIHTELSLDEHALARDIYERNRASERGAPTGDDS